VFESGRAARLDSYEDAAGGVAEQARALDIRSSVGVPIRFGGRLWGVMIAASTREEPLPPHTEAWLADFTELVATAIANAQAREQLRALGAEPAALGRVATLVARGAPPAMFFAAVAEELGRVLPADVVILRFDPDGSYVTIVGGWTRSGEVLPMGERLAMGGPSVSALVFETGRAARVERYGGDADVGPGIAMSYWESGVGAPISVEGCLWGVVVAASTAEEPLPPETEARLAGFTGLVVTAIAIAEAREAGGTWSRRQGAAGSEASKSDAWALVADGVRELRRVADEQSALRRVATLVARAAPEEVFAAVAEEAGRLLEVDFTILSRCESDGAQVSVGVWSGTGDGVPFPVGTRVRLGGRNVVSLVVETGRPARIDDYTDASGPVAEAARGWELRSAVGAPISVEGRLWGVIAAASGQEQPLPADTEVRLAGFTELVATAIANAQARVELRGFAEEQAALRRVATLVARAARPEEVFAAVAAEVGRLLQVGFTVLNRYTPDGTAVTVGAWTSTGDAVPFPVGTRVRLGGRDVVSLVFQTGRPARIDDVADASGEPATFARERGFGAVVGAPISVEGRLWGVVMVISTSEQPLPADTEVRLAGFTELVATALANAEAQAALTASRARIVAAADTTRRRFERDLHDGAQQRLIALALHLRTAVQAEVPPEADGLHAQLDGVAAALTGVHDELREMACGLHPAVLADGGLRPALKTLARRSAVPVRLDVRVERRLPEPVELAAYYVVSEALTNAAKHAHASEADVQVEAGEGVLWVRVRDDGRGGADLTLGSGLVGLKDRVEALGGRLWLHSPPGAGTTLQIQLPVGGGCVRDEAAGAFRRGTAQMLGLLLLDGLAPYFAELSRAIDDEAERRGWYLQVANSSRNENREMRHLNYFEAYRTRGIIVAPQSDISARLEQLTKRGMACVLLDPPHCHPAPDAIPSVAVDHVNGGSLAAQHLLDRGSRRFAFVGNTAQTHSQDRLAGFTATLRRARPDAVIDVIETIDLTVGAATPAADRIARLPDAERPDGLLAANDLVAIGLLHALANAGLQVPRDIRLVGYDDIDMAAELVTPLSTIRQPIEQLGTTAVRLLIEQIDGTTSGEAPHVVLQPELVVRATT
jgi:DNA-binding LacI/PurR family transcriptional regulator/signal transduction histidine kinase